MPEVVITEFMDDAAVEDLRERFEVCYDPVLADRPDDLPALMGGARALIVRNRTKVTRALLDAAPDLACVGRLGVGLDNIDTGACEARGIDVIPATGANDDAVAEYVITAALVLSRGAWLSSVEVAAGDWPRSRLIGHEVAGRDLGLIGFGGIARATATRARALGMNVRAADPFLAEDDPAWAGVERVDMDQAFAADIVSLHVPLTPDTRGLVDARRLGQMRPGAILINAARGGIVDEVALAAALQDGHIAGAALDVFAEEPLGAHAGGRFRGLNVLLTPHIAGVTVESNVRVSRLIAGRVADRLSA